MRSNTPFPRNAGRAPVDVMPLPRRAPKADSDGVKRELLAIAEEMRDVAARRAANDPHADTQLTSWAGRIQRALLNGETMETAMQAAQAEAARLAGYAEA